MVADCLNSVMYRYSPSEPTTRSSAVSTYKSSQAPATQHIRQNIRFGQADSAINFLIPGPHRLAMATPERPRGRRQVAPGLLEYQDLVGERAPRLSLDMKLPQNNPSYELAMFLRTTEPRPGRKDGTTVKSTSRGRSLQRRLVEYWKPPPPEPPRDDVMAPSVVRRKRSKSLRRQIIEYWKPGKASSEYWSNTGSVVASRLLYIQADELQAVEVKDFIVACASTTNDIEACRFRCREDCIWRSVSHNINSSLSSESTFA